MRKLLFTLTAIMLFFLPATAQKSKNKLRETSRDFFKTSEARRIGDQVLAYQRITGGWPKNIDMTRQLSDQEMEQVLQDKDRQDDSTTDNHATTMQLNYLSRLYAETGDTRYRDAFRRGIDYLLSGQYAQSGGWPQFWPQMRDYQIHITYNDDAMVNTMRLLRDVAEGKGRYGKDLTDDAQKQRMRKAFDRGIECILNTQITYQGELTVWCQQHDRETLLPAHARAYELPSFCSQESASIVRLLMEIPNPSERIKTAIHQAMKWFERHKLTGVRLDHFTNSEGKPDRRLISDPQAKPLWARYYDLENCRPYVCDRDGIPRQNLSDIGYERRTGYSWYNSHPAELFPLYDKWKQDNK